MGCALDSGAFLATYGEQSFKTVESEPETSLVRWFVWLMGILQSKANVPAIDWDEYGRALAN